MRKKSHISLARYLLEDMSVPEMLEHRNAFYLGSILPDCKPSFLTKRHEFDGTFDMVTEQIGILSAGAEQLRQNARAYMRHLGEVIHYLADYFTFPHNETYDGNIKDHCYYEKELKFKLRDYVENGQALREQRKLQRLESSEAIVAFIRNAHAEYLSRKRNVEEDCRYIVDVCYQVVHSIINLLCKTMEKGLCQAA